MKHFLTSLSLCFIVFFTNVFCVQAQTYSWVKGGGSTSGITGPGSWEMEAVYFMCTDYNGNVYALSEVGNGPPIAADTFYRPTGAYGANTNVLFTSHNCNGQMRFAKLITGGQIMPQGIATDNSGHVYLIMDMPHTGTGSTILRIGYDTTIAGFLYSKEGIIQYDTSGHLNWLRFVGNNTTSSYSGVGGVSHYLALDGMQHPHLISGLYSGVVLRPGDTSRYGYTDLEYDVAGNLLTVKHLGIDSTLKVDGLTIDKQSNKMYAYGVRNPSFPDSWQHIFLAALDIGRNLIWKDTLSNPYYLLGKAFRGIAADGFGHLYVSATGTRAFVYRGDTAKNVLSTTQSITSVIKMDTFGAPLWITVFSSTISSGLANVVMMPNNKIAVGGSIAGGTIVSGADTVNIYPGEGQNALFAVLDSGGYVHTLSQLHGIGFYDRVNRIVSDRVGNLYLGGQVENNIWAGSLTPYTSIGGNSDFYVMKYGVDCSCTVMPLANYIDTGNITRGFTYTGTSAGSGIDSVRWNFGDGGTSTLMNPIHSYTSPGTFTACVTVYTSCGSDMHCDTFTIICVAAPATSFSSTGSGMSKSFAYTGSTAGVSSITWDYGDASSTGSGTSPSHTYAASGIYTVCVTAVNPCGSSTHCHTVIACPAPAVASYTQTVTSLVADFTYTGTTTGIDSVRWDFGDGGTALGTTASHTYAVSDTYHVCVTVYTNCGNEVTCTDIVIYSLGIGSMHGSKVKVYPNPAKDELNIVDLLQTTTYRLLDITGVNLLQGTLQTGNDTISVRNIAPGIYILELTASNGERNMMRIAKQ